MARRAPRFLFGSLEEQLRAVPVRNVRVERADGPAPGSAFFTVDLTYGRKSWLARLLKARRRKKYLVDGLALELYDRLDGAATLADLMAWLMREHRLTFFESRGLAINFLHILVQRGLVAILAPAAPTEPNADVVP